MSVLPRPSCFTPCFAWCLFAGAALRMLNLVPLVAGGNIFCKGQGAGTTLAEAFDHADVSLIDLLDFDGDAAPIGAGVEEIERF